MREEYDFSEAVKNPYVKPTKATADYFKGLSEQVHMPYQTLINAYLADCAAKKIKPSLVWGQKGGNNAPQP